MDQEVTETLLEEHRAHLGGIYGFMQIQLPLSRFAYDYVIVRVIGVKLPPKPPKCWTKRKVTAR